MTIRTVVEKSGAALRLARRGGSEHGGAGRADRGDYGLHPLAVHDCLDPEHLPKYEVFENHTFVILRAMDETRRPDCRHGAGAHPQDRASSRAGLPDHDPSQGPARGSRRCSSAASTGLPNKQAAQERGDPGSSPRAALQCRARHLSASAGDDRDPARSVRHQGLRGAHRAGRRASGRDLREIHRAQAAGHALQAAALADGGRDPADGARRRARRRRCSATCRRTPRAITSMPTSCWTTPTRCSTCSSRWLRIGRSEVMRVLTVFSVVLPPAHLHRRRLRDELRVHARAARALGISRGPGRSWPW